MWFNTAAKSSFWYQIFVWITLANQLPISKIWGLNETFVTISSSDWLNIWVYATLASLLYALYPSKHQVNLVKVTKRTFDLMLKYIVNSNQSNNHHWLTFLCSIVLNVQLCLIGQSVWVMLLLQAKKPEQSFAHSGQNPHHNAIQSNTITLLNWCSEAVAYGGVVLDYIISNVLGILNVMSNSFYCKIKRWIGLKYVIWDTI